MKLVIKINEARFKDIQRIAEVQLEMNHFPTAEQIIAKGVPIEQEPCITWVTGADGAKIAFWDVPAWKVTKICEILGVPQESEVQE